MATDLADIAGLSVPMSSPAPALGAGDGIDRFVLLSRLSVSRTAAVYLAHDPRLERSVVLKLPPPEERAEATAEAWRAQAKLLARINNPQIASVFDLVESAHGPALVLEYLVGQSLDALVRARGPLPPPDAVHLFDQALAGLERLHRANVVHAGIDPTNLFVTTDQQVKLLDFRLARGLDGRERVSAGTAAIGNILYCPPEQSNGSGIDCRADLYALGACLFEAVTGALPFDKQQERAQAAPESLAGLALKATNKDPDQRFQTAHDFRLALRKFAAADAQLPALTAPPRAVHRRGARRFWTRFDLTLLALIVLLVMFLSFFPFGGKDTPARHGADAAALAQPRGLSKPRPAPPVQAPPPETDKYNALREAWGTE